MSASASTSKMTTLTVWQPDAAVVFGSGLASLPDGAVVEGEIGYADLGWPLSDVAGHRNLLQLARVAAAGGRELKLALACGRAHRYEGRSAVEVATAVRSLAATGVRRVVLTNSCGALDPEIEPGAVVVCPEVVDLQDAPVAADPPRTTICSVAAARAVVAAVAATTAAPGAVGAYVALLGPQFETEAEVTWLRRYGAVVGMSAAAEACAAAEVGVETLVLGLVANRAAAVGSHDDVLAAGGHLAEVLAGGLVPALRARWPGLI